MSVWWLGYYKVSQSHDSNFQLSCARGSVLVVFAIVHDSNMIRSDFVGSMSSRIYFLLL